jgi:hypothetical protein
VVAYQSGTERLRGQWQSRLQRAQQIEQEQIAIGQQLTDAPARSRAAR